MGGELFPVFLPALSIPAAMCYLIGVTGKVFFQQAVWFYESVHGSPAREDNSPFLSSFLCAGVTDKGLGRHWLLRGR